MTNITDKIAAALAATDTAARALWEAMGSPGEYWFGNTDHRGVCVHFHAVDYRGYATCSSDGALVAVRRLEGGRPEFEHEGTLDSARAALAAYLGAS